MRSQTLPIEHYSLMNSLDSLFELSWRPPQFRCSLCHRSRTNPRRYVKPNLCTESQQSQVMIHTQTECGVLILYGSPTFKSLSAVGTWQCGVNDTMDVTMLGVCCRPRNEEEIRTASHTAIELHQNKTQLDAKVPLHCSLPTLRR